MSVQVLYRIPFCQHQFSNVISNKSTTNYDESSGSGEDVTWRSTTEATKQEDADLSVWERLPESCHLSTIIIGCVGIVLLILGIVLNSILIASARSTKPKPIVKKSDTAAIMRRETFKISLIVSSFYRQSLSVSFLLLSAIVLPFLGLTAYEILFSTSHKSPIGIVYLDAYKMILCGIFHLCLSSSIFSMIGSVIERWIITSRLDPADFLEKVNNLMATPSNKLRKRSKEVRANPGSAKSVRKSLTLAYLLFVWLASVAFGALTVLYCQIRFLLFGEMYDEHDPLNAFTFISLLRIPRERMIITSILYLVFVFVPLVLLILLLILSFSSLVKLEKKAKKIETYDEAKLKSTSPHANADLPINHKLLQITQSNPKTEVKEEKRSNSHSERDENAANAVAEYSHKTEHERQVTLNCQETELNGIMTDSIQVSSDNAPGTSRSDSNTPLPPDWLKFTSLARVRYSDNSAIQVVDLASSTVAVSVDSARCYFGEANETRATLISFSSLSLFLLPLCAVLAIDVFSGKSSIFRSNSMTNSTESSEIILNPVIASSLGLGVVALYAFGGILLFILFYNTSAALKLGAKQICCTKKEEDTFPTQNYYIPAANKSNKSRYSKKDKNGASKSKSVAAGETRNGKANPKKRGSNKRPHSLDLEGWRPEERPTSDAFPEQQMDIERRFALDEEDE